MSSEEQLGWEARFAPFAAAAAILSSLLFIAATVVQASAVAPDDRESERRELIALSDADVAVSAATAVQLLSYLLFAGALLYLFRVTRARRPETPSWVPPLPLVAVLLFGVGLAISTVDVLGVADEFTASGEQSNRRAEDLLESRSALPVGLLYGARVALALSLVLIPLNAMRAGLLSRFMGVLGIAIGVLSVIPLLGGPVIVQFFWAIALGFLFLGRWPGGRGPAWETVEAIPWPTAAQRRQEAMEGGDEQAGSIPADDPTIEPAGDDESAGDGEPAGDDESAGDDEPAGDPSDPRGGSPHPVSKKRKRKRRR